MNDWGLSPKIRSTLWLMYGSAVYLALITLMILSLGHYVGKPDVTFLFGISVIPLLFVIAVVWGYRFRVKIPGSEISFYPVDRVMQPPSKISGGKTIAEAEELMEKKLTDFLNVVDRLGRFIGIFTKADAHRARKHRRTRRRIIEFMTPMEKAVKAQKGEKLIDVMEKIGKSKHSRLPVLDGEKVIGVVDSVDIQKILKESAQNEFE